MAFQTEYFGAIEVENPDGVALLHQDDDKFDGHPYMVVTRNAKLDEEKSINGKKIYVPVPHFDAGGNPLKGTAWSLDTIRVELSLAGHRVAGNDPGIKAYLNAVQVVAAGPRTGGGGAGSKFRNEGGSATAGSTFGKKPGGFKPKSAPVTDEADEIDPSEGSEGDDDIPF